MLKLSIKRGDNIGVQKSGSKCNFGFYKNGLLNGLGVTLSFRDPNLAQQYNLDTHRISD